MGESLVTLHSNVEKRKENGIDKDVEVLTFLYDDGHRYAVTREVFEQLLKSPYFKDVSHPLDHKRNPDVKRLRG